MILIQDLRKQYGQFTAVDGISLEVQPGQIHGFLGPNGAGKTTSIRMIAGLLKPTSGRIVVNGHDLATNPEGAEVPHTRVLDVALPKPSLSVSANHVGASIALSSLAPSQS